MVDNSLTPSTLEVYNLITENLKKALPFLYVTPYSKVKKEPVAFIFHPEEGSCVFLRNAAKFLSYYTACVLYNQRDATYTLFFIIISALHVDGLEQPINTSGRQQESMTIPKVAHTFFKLLTMGGKTGRNM